MFKVTQVKYGSPERLGNFPKITELSYGSRVVRQHTSENTDQRRKQRERSCNIPKITDLRCGSTEMSDHLFKVTQLRSGNREVEQLT